jgi:ribosomal protein RSM22 (predicted rRNA methylase)
LLTYKIETFLKGHSLKDLAKAREKLTRLYRDNNSENYFKALSTDDQRLAYLAARLPATHAVVCRVLIEALKRTDGDSISSLLDIGAGPGTVLLAAAACLPLTAATMVERDPGFIALGKRLTEDFEQIEKTWICQDTTKKFNFKPHDLVIASYSLGELKEKDCLDLIGKLWELTNKFLILIEPGTKVAFELLKKLRQSLLLKGAHLVAPCPHSNSCPLAEKDWCHFSARLERSSLHRITKEATLNYEDEKFSYLIFYKKRVEPCQSRVLRRPFKGVGYVKLLLCSKEGLEAKTITKKNKLQYAYARKIEWGDDYSEI